MAWLRNAKKNNNKTLTQNSLGKNLKQQKLLAYISSSALQVFVATILLISDMFLVDSQLQKEKKKTKNIKALVMGFIQVFPDIKKCIIQHLHMKTLSSQKNVKPHREHHSKATW